MKRALKNLALVVTGMLLVIITGVGLLTLNGINPFQLNRTDRSQPALLTSIQDISQYHAAVGNFEVLLDVEDDVPWLPDVLAGRRTLFVAAGSVDAYVDMSGLSDGDLVTSPDGTTVSIRLPEAELADPNLDQERSYLFSQDRGAFERVADAFVLPEQSEFYQDAETRMTAAAEESELRAQASENTRAMLTGMFASLDMQVAFLD
ncbi:DUF4230 domain-containing protein [Arthrobacter sp. N1]|uniref:DUF4230 domain-containing protein n=1 Tax=Arthrobacter sp. N1 TaxID=619291 RepID=UPI003BB1507D